MTWLWRHRIPMGPRSDFFTGSSPQILLWKSQGVNFHIENLWMCRTLGFLEKYFGPRRTRKIDERCNLFFSFILSTKSNLLFSWFRLANGFANIIKCVTAGRSYEIYPYWLLIWYSCVKVRSVYEHCGYFGSEVRLLAPPGRWIRADIERLYRL